MRFESFLWAALAFLLAGGTVWDATPGAQPQETELQFEAKDGNDKIPPP